MNPRQSIINLLIPYAKQDPRIFLLVCDMGFGVIDKYREELPNRLINIGIREQASVGIAAGMAMTGMIPIVYSICNFLCYRALEQIRNDIILQGLNVKFIGTGANDYFKFLGKSHCCGKQDRDLMNLIEMPTFDPYQGCDIQFEPMFKQWIESDKAGYIRV